tara:strand:- start:821 stop:1492 length:672 start_codon:yes stop_codon:yes gene_type:complete
MGVVILASDDAEFRVGDFIVMHRELTYPPTTPGVTYILHSNKWKESDIMEWYDLVPHRLVVIMDKLPKLTDKSKDVVIIHKSLKYKKQSWYRHTEAALKWENRTRALPLIEEMPKPLLAVWLKANRPHDIITERMLARTRYFLPEEYTSAVIAFSIKPVRGQLQWPTKKPKPEVMPPQFRESDVHWEILAEHAPEVTNLIRRTTPEDLPKKVNKRQTSLVEWL